MQICSLVQNSHAATMQRLLAPQTVPSSQSVSVTQVEAATSSPLQALENAATERISASETRKRREHSATLLESVLFIIMYHSDVSVRPRSCAGSSQLKA